MKVCDWTLEQSNRHRMGSGPRKWMAIHPERDNVWVYLNDRILVVHDDESYYPSGSYDVPLAVIEALQAREPR